MLASRGGDFRISGDNRLVIDAPKGTITPQCEKNWPLIGGLTSDTAE